MRISDWSSDVCSSDLDRRIVYRALSKSEVFEAFASAPQDLRLLDHHPPARVLDRDTPSLSTADAACLGATLYLKRSEEHTSELQSLMRISYAVFCLKKKNEHHKNHTKNTVNQHKRLK